MSQPCPVCGGDQYLVYLTGTDEDEPREECGSRDCVLYLSAADA